MTLKDFFELLSQNPAFVLLYFTIIPAMALLGGIFGKGRGHESPWKFLYSVLIYMVSIPGIFAITLSIYLFLFERHSIMDTNIYTQILPVISMITTLFIIKNIVPFERIPGFQRLSGLIMVIFSTLVFMWFINKTRIIVFSYLKIQYAFLIFVALLLLIKFGMAKFFSSPRDY